MGCGWPKSCYLTETFVAACLLIILEKTIGCPPIVKIITSEFNKYDRASLEEYILLQEETEFEIIIPRITYDFGPDLPEWLADEYILCGYAGELLSQTVTKFSYKVPHPFSTDPVIFWVSVEDFDLFIDTLYQVVKCAINDGEDVETHNAFYFEACDAFQQFSDGGIFVSLGLFGAAYQLYYPDIEAENEEEDEEEE